LGLQQGKTILLLLRGNPSAVDGGLVIARDALGRAGCACLIGFDDGGGYACVEKGDGDAAAHCAAANNGYLLHGAWRGSLGNLRLACRLTLSKEGVTEGLRT